MQQVVGAQTEKDLKDFASERVNRLVSPKTSLQDRYHVRHHRSIIKPFFLLYKAFFSEQFAATCPYHPSCSQFAVECVQQKGLIKGLLLALDRVTRCNSYVHTENSYLYYDPAHDVYQDTPDLY